MKYDQHFLEDEKVAKKIVSFLDARKNEKILEIGPGQGVLTQFLKGNVTLIEIDKDLFEELRIRFPGFKVINNSILKYNGNFDKIISNVPYSICEPLMNKLVKMNFKKAILMFPETFMEKGVLNLIMNHFFNVNELLKINKNSFYPVPRVDSKILEIIPRRLNEKEVVLRNIYLQSDKKLKNVFESDLSFKDKKIYRMNFNEWQELLNKLFP